MSLISPQLQAFMAVAKYKTVHAASSVVHITQTAVTQRIHALEAKLGTTLFTRTRRGMMLTPEGEALLRYCYAVNEIEGEALAKIKGAGIDSEIRITITGPSSIMRARIIPQCYSVIKKFPHLLVHFDINDLETRVRSLRAGESQLAVIRQEDVAPEMQHKTLLPERYVLVCTSAWKKRKLRDIIESEHIVDYDPSDQMTFNYLKHFDLFNLVKHERHFANRTDALAMMLEAGYGYGVLTTEFSNPYIQKNQLMVLNSGKIYKTNMVLAWYDRPEPPRYFSALINAIE
jgi:LysR family transcriptional regulator (chromosome initiation inhibitor)